MKAQSARRLLLAAALLLSAAWPALSQRPEARGEGSGKALSYSFISPNTGENLTLEEALKLLNSPEELELVRSIRALSLCLGLRPGVVRTIGNWSDGAEHSTLFRVDTDLHTLSYADARLGKLERQKSVLYFRHSAAGAGRMYVLRARGVKRDLAAVASILDRNGVAFRTLVPARGRAPVIYVVDLKDELRRQIARAARELRARFSFIKGYGEFIGDDADREKAQQVYSEIIREYEEAHPRVGKRCAR